MNKQQITVILILCLTVCIAPLALSKKAPSLKPPMGWMAWARFVCEVDCQQYPNSCINDKLFKSMADEIVRHNLDALGYKYINIDDCWSELERDPTSQALVANSSRFPNGGIKSLADYVHSKGLKLGIYGDCGESTCAGYPAQLKPATGNLSNVQDGDYFELDAKTLNEWQVDSFKVDGCFINPLLAESRCPKLADSIHEVEREILLTCEWPFYLNYAQKEANWQLVADKCNTWRYYDDIEDSWGSILNLIDHTVRHQDTFVKFHGPGHWFDPDQLEIGNYGLTNGQELAQMALWCIWSAPLYMSNDLRNISEQSLNILRNRKLIDVNQDDLGVFGVQTMQTLDNEDRVISRAFVKPVLPFNLFKPCTSFVVVYLNRDELEGTKTISYPLKDLLLNARLAIEQVEHNSLNIPFNKQTNGSELISAQKFNSSECLKYIENINLYNEFEVEDLVKQTTLEHITSGNLTLSVDLMSVRVVKIKI